MLGPVRYLGRQARLTTLELGRSARFAGALLRATALPPLRVRAFVDELYKIGVLSLVVIGVSGLAVGMVLSLQGYNTLARFGATDSLGAVVGLSLIRELGPVLTALLVAGRAGSATTAEIGTMVATEQMDGLRMMSIDPVDWSLQPKALAMLVAMPLLSALFICAGIGGGALVGSGLMGVDPGVYRTSLDTAVEFGADVLGSFVKSVAFGGLVGLISTYRGYTCVPTSAGVSAATTSTVVLSSVGVLLLDYVLTALWGV